MVCPRSRERAYDPSGFRKHSSLTQTLPASVRRAGVSAVCLRSTCGLLCNKSPPDALASNNTQLPSRSPCGSRLLCGRASHGCHRRVRWAAFSPGVQTGEEPASKLIPTVGRIHVPDIEGLRSCFLPGCSAPTAARGPLRKLLTTRTICFFKIRKIVS